MASQLEIYNMALGRLRVKKATSTNTAVDTSRQTAAVDREYAVVRNTLLSGFPWSFATQRIILTEHTDPDDPGPAGVWVGRFKLFDSAQSEYNRIIKITEVRSGANGALLDYEWTTDKDELGTYQQWLFTTTTEDIVVTAVIEQDNTEKWPEHFVDAVAWALAEAVSIDLTDSVSKADYAETKAARALLRARLIDMSQKREVPRLRMSPAYSPRAARLGGSLTPVEGETP